MSTSTQETTTIRELGRPGDLGWVVMANAEQYADQFGWDATYEALVVRIVADYADAAASPGGPARHRAWIAEVDGVRAGCVFCVAGDDPGVAKLRLLLVDASYRGLGLGSRLVSACLDFARASGHRRVELWTNSVLGSARRIYEAEGFELVAEDPHHSFGRDLVGQTWSLDL